MYGNWIKESTATAGTGTITLAAVSSFERFGTVFANNDPVFYVIQDGTSREFGIGTWLTGNFLARTTVLETWVASVRTVAGATAINLSGSGVFVYNDPGFQYMPLPRFGPDLSAAATTSIWGKNGDFVNITGGGTITSFGTVSNTVQSRWLRFAASTTLSLGVTGSVLGGSMPFVMQAGSLAYVMQTATGHIVIPFNFDGTGANPCLSLNGGTMVGDILMSNNSVAALKWLSYNSELDNGNSGTGLTINPFNGAYQKVTLNTATPILTIAAPFGVSEFQLRIIQDATGGRVPSFAGAAYSTGRWYNSAAQPAMNTAIGGSTIVKFYYDGTNLYQRSDKIGAV